MGELRRLVEEEVLDHEEVELGEGLLRVVEVGLRQEGVLAHDVHRADPPVEAALDHVRHDEAGLGRRPDAPGALELRERRAS